MFRCIGLGHINGLRNVSYVSDELRKTGVPSDELRKTDVPSAVNDHSRMPRKSYTPKNRYCRNSNLSEETFLGILWYFLQGASAPTTRAFMMADTANGRLAGRVLSVKSIATYQARLGNYLCERTFEPFLINMAPDLSILKDRNHDAYIDIVDTVARNYVNDAIAAVNYSDLRILNSIGIISRLSSDLDLEIRKITNAKRGVKVSHRFDVSLAMFRCTAPRFQKASDDDKYLHFTMLKNLENWLISEPL